MEHNVRAQSILFIVVVLFFGIIMLGYGAYSHTSQSAALDQTETVNATISSTSVEYFAGRGGEYSPRASFNYTYEGETYTSSTVYPGGVTPRFSSEDNARAELEGYDPGAIVTAYLPTDSPDDAFLKTETTDRPLYFLGAGALLSVVSLVLIAREKLFS
ncbi:MAG: hypothetical protein J07HX64_00694 [halophilic archaeon J07HX64]|jgi:Protein of unknown function (DUF3592).|nr:MAG: hypothetical protein J07HX64_00694 [halophilic archaeon J07HX64]